MYIKFYTYWRDTYCEIRGIYLKKKKDLFERENGGISQREIVSPADSLLSKDPDADLDPTTLRS